MGRRKILLLNPPGDKQYIRDYYCSTVSKAGYYWHPIDLLFQSGIIGSLHDVDIIDAIASRKSSKQVINDIKNKSYDAIFFLTSSQSWETDFKILENLKKRNEILIGSGEIFCQESWKILKKFDFIDAALLDFTSDDVIHYLNGNYNKIKTMTYRLNNDIKYINNPTNYTDFSIPIPKHELFPLKMYKMPFMKFPIFATLLTTYSCPFSCKFCNSGRSNLVFKKRNLKNVIEEMIYITSLGIKQLFFKDMTFGVDRNHSFRLCEEILENKLQVCWNCYSRIELMEEELLDIMIKSGCYLIQFGIESWDEELLSKYGKASLNSRTMHILKKIKKKRNKYRHTFHIRFSRGRYRINKQVN